MNYKEKIEYIRKQEAEKKAQAEALAKKESNIGSLEYKQNL